MDALNKAEQLKAARALIEAIEQEDDSRIKTELMALTNARESELFQHIGKLTRELHEALNNFKVDARLVDLTHIDMPDTRDRLNYVIETTEEAAHKTLGYIDKTLPLANELKQTAAKLNESWQRFRNREMSATEFRDLSREIEAYLPVVNTHAGEIHNNLSEMTLAQGFQDLTGQVLRQVIGLVEEVENNLVKLVKVAGQTQQSGETKVVDPLKAEGPQINAKNKPNVVNSQDDVDDLLSSLGF
ncbi:MULTISPECIES: protein phosphatase CheZ [unclassified Methylophaga]|jgi:chemotaxis protein CheZ|uniref:protein phosphatase CheZ n=1 Tax=unclassified Methylophaga TaxID=2629249 RepID=UPI000C90A6AF|nr:MULTISPECIES: protein phosphatase CheZ [unclassified Methylophaga]MAK66506.1 chemotaxis protein CheZ [Methylophaga sp.]MAY17199.1 chemotaxis protein CheZ [Methylophaga sp.]HAO24181.1 chemotaxis protein CheZ [Methylophaga sp.]|tara:strand:+ start:3175 stop:3906 length:732 start_codon:yes stop_codon:yes gene_type:complete